MKLYARTQFELDIDLNALFFKISICTRGVFNSNISRENE